MKQNKSSAFFSILILIFLTSPQLSRADQQWHFQASAQVTQPGLIETVLPAGVFFGTDNAVKTSQLDLTLVGPDGNPRSFELFWKGDTRPRTVALKPSRLLFDKRNHRVTSTKLPNDMKVDRTLGTPHTASHLGAG
jgi:hypothetical protein